MEDNLPMLVTIIYSTYNFRTKQWEALPDGWDGFLKTEESFKTYPEAVDFVHAFMNDIQSKRLKLNPEIHRVTLLIDDVLFIGQMGTYDILTPAWEQLNNDEEEEE